MNEILLQRHPSRQVISLFICKRPFFSQSLEHAGAVTVKAHRFVFVLQRERADVERFAARQDGSTRHWRAWFPIGTGTVGPPISVRFNTRLCGQ